MLIGSSFSQETYLATKLINISGPIFNNCSIDFQYTLNFKYILILNGKINPILETEFYLKTIEELKNPYSITN